MMGKLTSFALSWERNQKEIQMRKKPKLLTSHRGALVDLLCLDNSLLGPGALARLFTLRA
jgi:hypothetical protein